MTTTRTYCPQCNTDQRVAEPYAFGGRDKLRTTLSCGHVVLRPLDMTSALDAYEAACARGTDADISTAALALAAAVRVVVR
jgi:hypothetical protein